MALAALAEIIKRLRGFRISPEETRFFARPRLLTPLLGLVAFLFNITNQTIKLHSVQIFLRIPRHFKGFELRYNSRIFDLSRSFWLPTHNQKAIHLLLLDCTSGQGQLIRIEILAVFQQMSTCKFNFAQYNQRL